MRDHRARDSNDKYRWRVGEPAEVILVYYSQFANHFKADSGANRSIDLSSDARRIDH